MCISLGLVGKIALGASNRKEFNTEIRCLQNNWKSQGPGKLIPALRFSKLRAGPESAGSTVAREVILRPAWRLL